MEYDSKYIGGRPYPKCESLDEKEKETPKEDTKVAKK